MTATFNSKLPEKARVDELEATLATGSSPHGKFITRVFDGDLCASREEAYQKFRERQIREAMHGGSFF